MPPNRAALARASKQNLTDFFRFTGHSPATRYSEAEGMACWRTPLAHPWFNGILLRRAPRPGDSDRLARLSTQFDDLAHLPFTLWLEPDVAREPWAPLLAALGFLHEPGAPGMALTFNRLPGALAFPPRFSIEPVRDDATLRVWAETFVRGYELPDGWIDGFYRLFAGLGEQEAVANYLGRLDGEPVATSNVFYSAGVAGVQFVATVPQARRRGLGGLMTLHPLYDAQRHGLEAAVLQSSEMGYNVYKRLGFEHVANVDNEYRPAPGAPA